MRIFRYVDDDGLRAYLPLDVDEGATKVRLRARARRRWYFVVTALLVAMWLLFGVRTAAEACVSVRVTNGHGRTVQTALGPATVFGDARVQPDTLHRWIELTWDLAPELEVGGMPSLFPGLSDIGGDADQTLPSVSNEAPPGAVGRSGKSLNGALEPILYQRKMTGLQGGRYAVVASVYNDHEKKALCARNTAFVLVSGGTP